MSVLYIKKIFSTLKTVTIDKLITIFVQLSLVQLKRSIISSFLNYPQPIDFFVSCL